MLWNILIPIVVLVFIVWLNVKVLKVLRYSPRDEDEPTLSFQDIDFDEGIQCENYSSKSLKNKRKLK